MYAYNVLVENNSSALLSLAIKNTADQDTPWWVSFTSFGIPFRLTVQLYHLQTTSLEEFQQHISITSKFIHCGFYMKKNVIELEFELSRM